MFKRFIQMRFSEKPSIIKNLDKKFVFWDRSWLPGFGLCTGGPK